MELKPQKKKEHYFKPKYNKLDRFVSYFYQVYLVEKFAGQSGRKVLEIGKGNGLVSDYLKQSGFDVTTFDFDKNLNPDMVGDVREINLPENSFDIVTVFEVLEHIPFEEVDNVLERISKITRKYLIVSLPYRSTGFGFVLKFPGIRSLINRDFMSLFVRIQLRFRGIKISGQHYWEISSNSPLKRIKALFKGYFDIIRVVRPVLDNYRIFFVLEKKGI